MTNIMSNPKKKKKKPKNIVEMPKVKKKDKLRYQGGYCCAVNCYNCEGGDVRFFKVMRKKDQIQSEKWIKAIGKVIDTKYISTCPQCKYPVLKH